MYAIIPIGHGAISNTKESMNTRVCDGFFYQAESFFASISKSQIAYNHYRPQYLSTLSRTLIHVCRITFHKTAVRSCTRSYEVVSQIVFCNLEEKACQLGLTICKFRTLRLVSLP